MTHNDLKLFHFLVFRIDFIGLKIKHLLTLIIRLINACIEYSLSAPRRKIISRKFSLPQISLGKEQKRKRKNERKYELIKNAMRRK